MTEASVRLQNAVSTKWLITGGCGFIGTSLIRYLKKDEPNARIRVMDNLSVGTREDLSSVCEYKEVDRTNGAELTEDDGWIEGVQLVVRDIRDYNACLACTKGVDVVVHLAANTGVAPSVENPRSDMEANVIGTFNMLEASRNNKVCRFVFASSGAPIGEIEPPIHEELAPHPVSPYGASKLACEGYCSAFYRTFGIHTVVLRFGNVYGPGSTHKNSVVAKFIKQALNGETLQIYGDGQQTRDFIYIEDLCCAILLAASKEGIGGEAFQIATNSETTLSELTKMLLNVLSDCGVHGVRKIFSEPRLGDVIRNFSDTSKAASILGWKAGTVLIDGLTETVQWFMNV